MTEIKETIEKINTGFIEEIWPTDFIAAIKGPSPEVLKGLDMRKYRSSHQWQAGKNGDKQCCVSQARTECEESWLNYLYQSGKMAKKSREFLEKNGYIVNGRVELNVRALAQWSGTTEKGNSIPKVCVTAHQKGFGPRNYPGYADDAGLPWNEYYKNPDAKFEALAKEYRQHFKDYFDWVITGSSKHTDSDKQQMAYNLNQGVLLVASATCYPWSAKTPPACSLSQATHAYEIDYIPEDKKFLGALDHYEIFEKEMPYNYIIPWAMKIVVENIASDGPAPLIPPGGVGSILRQNDEPGVPHPALYMFGLDNLWHGLGSMDILSIFKGKYDPSKTIRVPQLPSNIGFTITKEDVASSTKAISDSVFTQLLQLFNKGSMKLVQKYPKLGSSVDPDKFSRTIKNLAAFIVAVAALKNINISNTEVDTYVFAIISIYQGILTLFYGVVRVINWLRNKGYLK